MRGGVIILLTLLLAVQNALAVTEAQRLDAIQRIQTYLLSKQDPRTGSWDTRYSESSRHQGGETALVVYALLRSGMSAQEPKIKAGIDYLKTVDMRGTYAISLRAHCWAALSDDYRSLLEDDARWLLKAQVDGLFDYGPRTGPRYDHSVTQYGLLGLWESSKRRGPTANRLWQQTSQHFIDTQNPDGGWGYQARDRSTQSMTAAGLTALLIAQENLYRSRDTPPKDLTFAINGAITWLDAYVSAKGVTVRDEPYYLVGLERVALASGIRTLGGTEWFHAGAESIINSLYSNGSIDNDLVDSAFSLIFLSRGGVPVWANKVQLYDQDWNNRPNDLNILTRTLSDQLEVELGWQLINAESDSSLWLNAPVAYLASDKSLTFSAAESANLEYYLDLGGILIATPDSNSQGFSGAIRSLAKTIYPEYEFKRAPADHPLLGLIHQVDLPESKRPWILSNGARDLIVLASDDWGMDLQRQQGGQPSQAQLIMANLYAMVTDRGKTVEPLDAFNTERINRTPLRTIRVARAHVHGNKPLEPLSWFPLSNILFNRTGYDLSMSGVGINHVGEVQADLIHLGSSKADRLTSKDLRELSQYISKGGTILIETIGGRGDQTDVVLKQFEAVLGERAAPLAPDHPILTGNPIGLDMRRVTYRRFSTLNRGLIVTPRLLSIKVNGRDAVIASHEDLSLGVLGCRHWGIDGYDIDSARGLVMNILLYASDRKHIEKQQNTSTTETETDSPTNNP